MVLGVSSLNSSCCVRRNNCIKCASLTPYIKKIPEPGDQTLQNRRDHVHNLMSSIIVKPVCPFYDHEIYACASTWYHQVKIVVTRKLCLQEKISNYSIPCAGIFSTKWLEIFSKLRAGKEYLLYKLALDGKLWKNITYTWKFILFDTSYIHRH